MKEHVLRSLTKEDSRSSIELGMYAFQIPLKEEEIKLREENFMSSSREYIGVFQGKQLCSQLAICNFEFTFQGSTIQSGGIASVSTWPEYRRGGHVSKLMQESLLRMYNQGQIFSVLYPFSVGFYRKYGYELFIEKVRNLIPISYILKKEYRGQLKRINEYIQLREVYEQYAKQFTGMLVRTEEYWKNTMKLKKPGYIMGYYEEDTLQGYLIYSLKDKLLHITEFVTLSHTAKQALWTFVAQHDSKVEHVEWLSDRNDITYTAFANPIFAREIKQEAMARIVDCEKFISQYRFNPVTHLDASENEATDTYLIDIEDRYAQWNEGVHLLKIGANGYAKLEKYNGESNNPIKLTINLLTAILLGYKNLEYYLQSEQVSGPIESLKRLQKRIPEQKTLLLDYF